MAKVQISLPDQLAEQARRAGSLSSDRLEKWPELKTHQVDELFSAIDRMSAVPGPAAMSPEEVGRDRLDRNAPRDEIRPS